MLRSLCLCVALALPTTVSSQGFDVAQLMRYEVRATAVNCGTSGTAVESPLGIPSKTVNELFQDQVGAEQAERYLITGFFPTVNDGGCTMMINYLDKRFLAHAIPSPLPFAQVGWRRCVPYGINGREALDMFVGTGNGPSYEILNWGISPNPAEKCLTIQLSYVEKAKIPQPKPPPKVTTDRPI